MSWRDRLRSEINLIAPDGETFTAFWQGNNRIKNKKLGIFNYPNFDGSNIQDLGVNGVKYPLNIFFAGENNDITANNFFKACDQRGTWLVVHPTKGNLDLQLISVQEVIQPVKSGNITEFRTQWVVPSPDSITRSNQQVAAELELLASDVNNTSSDQYNNNLDLDTADGAISNETAILNSVENTDSAFSDLISGNNELINNFNQIQRGITDTLNQAVLEPLVLAGQVQQLIQLPVLAARNIPARIEGYVDLLGNTFNLLPLEIDPAAKNSVSAYELSSSAALVGLSLTVVNGDLDTRTDALNYAEQLATQFNEVTNNLDNIQENFKNNDIDLQYFSNSLAYVKLSNIISLALRFLIDSALSLKIEKRFTLDRPRSPLEITITEYGDLGDEDINLDFFITTNKLTGDDIRLLPAGREVVVYV
jgi:hypothetical protein